MNKDSIKELIRGDYNYNKYWTRRHALFNPKVSKLKKIIYNRYINKTNMKFGASITHNWSDHDNFLTPPILGHGIMGIIMNSDAIIGHNVFIS